MEIDYDYPTKPNVNGLKSVFTPGCGVPLRYGFPYGCS